MEREDVEAIAEAVREGADPDAGGVALAFVPLAAIEANGWDMNIGRYVRGETADELDLHAALAAYLEAPRGRQLV
jgi:type I restriction enzyme M protein